MPDIKKTINTAQLSWDADENPYSEDYQDIYYSQSDALAESSYVFLKGNKLPSRWREMNGQDFVIAECGFGGGLNFLNTCRLWCKSKTSRSSTLYYLATELHPFRNSDLLRLYKKYPELSPYFSLFYTAYPSVHPGMHYRELYFGSVRVVLILLLGDSTSLLKQIQQKHGFRVDAWFLDGFAPAVNADMWSAELCQLIASLSKAGTSLSTYSAAGTVKQALKQNGFEVSRKPGFANKRHMLVATFQPDQHGTSDNIDWFQLPAMAYKERKALIVGGGMAGCATAAALAKSGWKVSLLESESEIASKASGNSRGIVYCKLSSSDDPRAAYYVHAYLYAMHHYRQMAKDDLIDWHDSGLLQLAFDDREKKRQQHAMSLLAQSGIIEQLNADEASQICGHQLEHGGLFFPNAGYLNPRALCQAYLQHENITVITSAEVCSLKHNEDRWQLITQDGRTFEAPVTVIANSKDALKLEPARHYPLTMNFGQADEYAFTGMEHSPACIICAKGYILPTDNGVLVGGITRQHTEKLVDTTELARQNLALINNIDKAMADCLNNAKLLKSHYAYRSSTPDYLPLVGPVENHTESMAAFGFLKRNARKTIQQDAVYESGLFINVGHGSHGLTSTPLAASYLANLLNQSPLPISNAELTCLHPLRNLIRDLKKQRLGVTEKSRK